MTFHTVTSTIYVTDQTRAKSFYLDTLGFELQADRMVTETFRWISVFPKGKPDQAIALFSADDAGVGVDPETGKQMAALVESGAFSVAILETHDCHRFCKELKQKGVSFIAEAEDKPWGVTEALIRDDSGNRIAIVERH